MTLKPASRPVPSNPTGPLQGDPPPEIPRDQWGRPLVIPYSRWQGPGVWALPEGFTRASTLGATCEDQWGLNEWKAGLAVTAATQSESLILRGRLIGLGPSDKKARAELGRDALARAETDSAASIGTSLHHLADRVDRGEPVPDVGEYNTTIEAYRGIASYFRFHAIELFVVNEDLRAAGTMDRLGELREGWELVNKIDGLVLRPGVPLVLDLKSSSTADYFGIKFCVQFAVYAGGRPYRHLASRSIGRGKAIEVRGEYLDWPDGAAPSPDWGLIIHAPAGQQDIVLADMLHWVPLEAGRELAGRANQVREDRKAIWIVPAGLPVAAGQSSVIGRALTSAEAGETVPVALNGPAPARPASTDALIKLIHQVESTDELDRLWDQYGESSVWTEECTRAAEDVTGRINEMAAGENERESSQDALLSAIRMASSEEQIRTLWERSQLSWTEECTAAASVTISRLNKPRHVRQLELTRKIQFAGSGDEIDQLFVDHSDIWNDGHTRMRSAVLRNLSVKD